MFPNLDLELVKKKLNKNNFFWLGRRLTPQTKDELCQEIMKGGTNYWGDHILLQLLCSILQINLLILNCDDTMNQYDIYHTMIDYNPEYKTILLLYEDRMHFKLIGY